jgi:CelD/BcsL family acetyltransferase involved in cellulose biosynthesis
MRVFCVENFAELTPYANNWQRLVTGSPFCDWTWLSNWWRHYGPRDDAESIRTRLATFLVLDNDNSLVGIAPWYIERSAMNGRVLRPLGSGEVCSDYLSLLCEPGSEEGVVQALAEYLFQSAGSGRSQWRWDLLRLDGIDAEDHTMTMLAQSMVALGCAVHRRAGRNCWRLELPADWETYVASLSKNLRRDVRRLERDLLNTNRVVLHAAEQMDELSGAMDILVELHQRRRESLGEKGCFASERFLGFYRAVMPELLRHGQLQFYWLEVDGRPVAAECQLVCGGVLYTYQAGMDPAAAAHEPGKLIYLMILRRAIEHGYRAFDFLRGDEPYKARFGAQPRASIEFHVVPPRAAARLRHGLWLTGKNVKQWIKRGVRGQGSGARGQGNKEMQISNKSGTHRQVEPSLSHF